MQQYISDDRMQPGRSKVISYLSLLTHVRDETTMSTPGNTARPTSQYAMCNGPRRRIHVPTVGGAFLSPYTKAPFTTDSAPSGLPPLLTAPWMILTSLSHEASEPLKYDPRSRHQ